MRNGMDAAGITTGFIENSIAAMTTMETTAEPEVPDDNLIVSFDKKGQVKSLY